MVSSCSFVGVGAGIHQNGGRNHNNRQRRKGLAFGALPLASYSLALVHLVLLAVVSIDVAVVVGGSSSTAEGTGPHQMLHRNNLKSQRNSQRNSQQNHKRNLIINGEPVNLPDHSFYVRSWPDSVAQTSDVLCGASLIHSDMIVTAAHCQGAFNYGAMAYNPSSRLLDQYRNVDLQIVYPDYYQTDSINYDIMIVRLSSPITNIVPIVLNYDPDFPIRRNPKKDEASPMSFLEGAFLEGSFLEGLGLGITETGRVADGLEVGLFSALSNDQCLDRLGTNTNAIVTEDILCADPSTDESICLGDSGGPLTAWVEVEVKNNDGADSPWSDSLGTSFMVSVPVQVGVISFGNDCESDWIPDGFARISYFVEWITEQICQHSRDPPPECSEYENRQSENSNAQSEAGQYPEGTVPPGMAKVILDFQHDFLAEETIFVVRNTLKDSIEYTGPQYVPRRGERVSSTFLLPVPGNYALEVHDQGGNGLRNPDYINPNYTPGSWILSAEYSNGSRLESIATGDSQFEFIQTTQFRLPEEEKAPTGATKTREPSMSPTEAVVSTGTPTGAPTETPVPILSATATDASSSASLVPTTMAMMHQSLILLGWASFLVLS
uniref:Peptidase S1 domain-containing protein n=1 Tax=Pseudo-nitzschia australis TaxID=44445 RepID=A0A7S4AIX2_9STRA|mmetsp:Transcript_12337/g.26012  ORF Transcript_12337/g.26012 Transcript_12337/m.26012 type:complete len:607 (-) Transcript_12337:1627-3447(-)